ncbi:MAG TPA: SPASM domain-containing protein [Aliidongia sp.]|nr:SPASM domain-containing protein [Aliidongia sp.]
MSADCKKTRCAYPWQQMVIDLTGEVVPCCFYSAYGGSEAKPFGNTNGQTLEEIWNGPGYQDLRRRHIEGDLENHPCDKCVAYYWNNEDYPKFQWPSGVVPEQGKAYLAKISEQFQQAIGDRQGEVKLFEDGVEIGPGNSMHADIRSEGGGRYSVWNGTLYFAPPDDSDPVTNGRTYELRLDKVSWTMARFDRRAPSGENLQLAYEEYRKGSLVQEAKPTMLTWSSTADCNIDCGYCSQNMYRAVKLQHRGETEDDVLALVPQLIYFSWAGGEPYFLKNFRKFIDEYVPGSNPNLTFGFTSNGTLLSEKELEKLNKFPRLSASFSIDSFSKDSFEKLRYGASYKRVIENILRAVATNDTPDRSFICGQLVLKSNFLELPDNVRFAIANDIGVNFSPVTTYPINERIDIHPDFAAIKDAWNAALDEAMEIAQQARDEGSRATQRVDLLSSLSAVRAILDATAERYRTTAPISFLVEDPHGSLEKMKLPGIFVSFESIGDRPLTYVPIDRGPGIYVCHAPLAELGRNDVLRWDFLADLQENWVRHVSGHIFATDGKAWHKSPLRAPDATVLAQTHIIIPEFVPPERHRNAKVANAGLPVPDGLAATSEQQMWRAVQQLEVLEKQAALSARTASRPLISALERSPQVRQAYAAVRQIVGDLIE